MYAEFEHIMTEVLDPKSLRNTKYKKYLNLKKNFDRTNKQIKSLVANGHTYGLDFGCGVGFGLVLGKLHGIEIVGLDIPHYSGANPVYDAKGGPSPFISSQNKLKELGYTVVLRDTMEFPWNEFKDDQFEFVMSFFSITKHFGNDGHEWDWEKRLEELKRVTKSTGTWYIGPKCHHVTVERQTARLNPIKLRAWGTKQVS